ncbi:MAG: diguanylate cyclase, partial [Pseudomonadota bacterium]|nr:diguanylate cyclase [Pseudomonadota bacterium]
MGLVLCVLIHTGHASGVQKITDPGAFLDQTESMRLKDHRQFTQRLVQIHRESPVLSESEQWHLKYLDAFEASLNGHFTAAEKPLRDVIENSGDPALAAKASANLLTNLAASRRYEDAFTLAHRLTISLPELHDSKTRVRMLGTLSQMFNLAGQTDLAVKYARMMDDAVPEDMTECYPRSILSAALYSAKKLSSSSTELRKAIAICQSAQQPILAAADQLILSTLYLEEKQPGQALSLLNRIAPAIKTNHDYPHELSAQVQRAQALHQLGKDRDAWEAALLAVAMKKQGEISNYLRDAYELLYQIAKNQGKTATALSYYEHYVAQDKGYRTDTSAQVLAYQSVHQHVLAREMESEALGRQNSILKLQQALDIKAVETSRLYISLLLIALASIALWLYRIKRSQLRFKSLSQRDGLTGILNYQYFVSEAERVLRQLEKKSDEACLVSIDLDHFKRINDTHGHAVGDAVLRHTVATCQQQLRPIDLFGRLGGEEFGILLRSCSRERGMEIANRIRKAIGETPMKEDQSLVSVSASVGLAATDVSGYNLQRLCMEADAALYRAKRGGRNRVIADIGDCTVVE